MGAVQRAPHVSPITGKPVWLSASGFRTFKSCRRRWWYQKVLGRKEPTDATLATGLAVHAMCEHYLLHGEWVAKAGDRTHPDMPDLDVLLPCAQAGQDSLDVLRAHEGQWAVEHAIRLRDPGPSAANPFHLPLFAALDWLDDSPMVVDHKTTGDLQGRYHLTEEGLAQDPQMLLYAGLAFFERRPEAVTLRHLYYQVPTKGKPPGHRALSVTVPWATVQATLDTFVGASAEMVAAINTPEEAVAATPSACRMYGRLCPFADRCSESPTNRNQAVTSEAVKALLATTAPAQRATGAKMSNARAALLKGITGGSTPNTAKAEPTGAVPDGRRRVADPITPPDAAPTPTPTSAQVKEAADMVRAVISAGVAYPGDEWLLDRMTSLGIPHTKLPAVRAAAGLTPGAAPAPAAPAPAAPAPAAPAPTEPGTIGGVPTQAEGDLAMCRDAVAAFLADPGRKRRSHSNARKVACDALDLTRMGKPRWAELVEAGEAAGVWVNATDPKGKPILLPAEYAPAADASAQEAQEAAEPHPTPSTPSEPAAEPAAPDPVKESAPATAPTPAVRPSSAMAMAQEVATRHLVLVGCMAATLPSVPLETALGTIPADVARAKGVTDWRALDYNEGARLIAAHAIQALRAGTLALPPCVHVDARSPLVSHLVPVLEGWGATVVQGVR